MRHSPLSVVLLFGYKLYEALGGGVEGERKYIAYEALEKTLVFFILYKRYDRTVT
jgi:hypothetical protein